MRRIFLSVFISLLLSSCSAFNDPGLGDGNARISVYMNDPGVSEKTMVYTGVDLELAELIDQAEQTVYLSVYNFSKQSIIDAILRAEDRNLEVKVVGDIDEYFTHGYQEMAIHGVDMSLGNTGGIQHNKFCVVDSRYVFTGTGNLSNTDMDRNNNNWYILESPEMAEHYTAEFMQMYNGLYGSKKRPRALEGSFTVNGIPIEIYFSPYEGADAMDALIDLVRSADTSIHYMIFAFTHDELDNALVDMARNQHVPVYGVHDSTFVIGVSEEAPKLYAAGFNDDGSQTPFGPFVRWDGNENTAVLNNPAHGGKLHAKTMIIDAGTDHAQMATGSFNWSTNAIDNNDENLLIIRDAKIANTVYEQWKKVWSVANDMETKVGSPSGDNASMHDVIISEVSWAGRGRDGTSPVASDDFIEIYNNTNYPIDLSHWTIEWSNEKFKQMYPIPDSRNWYYEVKNDCGEGAKQNLLCPGAFRVIFAENPSAYAVINSQKRSSDNWMVSGTKNFKLEKNNFKLRLYDKGMNLIDEAGDGGNAPAGGFDGGIVYSMVRRGYDSGTTKFVAGKMLTGSNPAAWYTNTTDSLVCLTPTSDGTYTDDFDNNSDTCTGAITYTYATPGKPPATEEAPKIVRVEVLSDSSLNVYFDGEVSNCYDNGDLDVDVYSAGYDNIAGTVSLSNIYPGMVRVSVGGATPFATATKVFKIVPTATCTTSGGAAANTTAYYFNGYGASRATVEFTKVDTKAGSIDLKVNTGGSVSNLRIYDYSESGLREIYRFGALQVAADDVINVHLKASAESREDILDEGSGTRATPYTIDLVEDGLAGTENVLYLAYCDLTKPKYCSTADIQDIVYYSDCDNDSKTSMMHQSLRFLYSHFNSSWSLPQRPKDEWNDAATQGASVCLTSGKVTRRTGVTGIGKDKW